MAYWLLEIAVRGLVIAGVGSLAVMALYRATAATRALLWAGLLTSLLALAPANLLLPRWEVPILVPLPADRGEAERTPEPEAAREGTGEALVDRGAFPTGSGTATGSDHRPARALGLARAGDLSAADGDTAPQPRAPRAEGDVPVVEGGAPPFDFARVAVLLWLSVSAALLARLLLGVVGARRLLQRAHRGNDPAILRQLGVLAGRAGVEPVPDLLYSREISIPVAVHLGRPAILVPDGFEAWSQRQRASVLLHELAHLHRYDGWVQLLARTALAVHWFNPLAWVAASRLWLERERACDDFVLRAGLRPSDYAGDLLAVARRALPSPVPAAVAFARTEHLAPRVRSILASPEHRRSPRWSTLMTLPALLLALLVPAAAAFPVAVAPQPPPASPGTPPGINAVEVLPAAPSALPQEEARPSIDELVRMRIHGVSPEFIDAMSEVTADLDVDRLVELRIHGVTPEYARAMRAAFGRQLDLDELVQSRIHGVSPEFAADMAAVFGQDLDFDSLRQMRIHGVQAELVRAARDAFGAEATAERIVKMRIHGISAESITAVRALLSYETIGVEDLVRMRIHRIDEEMIRELQQAGYDDLTVDELVKIKIHGLAEMMKRRSGGSR